jgi:hypothetical protein
MKIESPDFTDADLDAFLDDSWCYEVQLLADRLSAASARLSGLAERIAAAGRRWHGMARRRPRPG